MLLERNDWVKALVVFVVGAVCWGVHNLLEVVAFFLGNVGLIARVKRYVLFVVAYNQVPVVGVHNREEQRVGIMRRAVCS